MATHCATSEVVQVSQAAAEIARLYNAFDQAAVKLTPDYIEQRLAGEEDVTWAVFPKIGLHGRPTPILDAVVRHEGAILLGAGYNMWHELLYEYRLTEAATLVPDGEDAFVRTDAFTVRRARQGFDPGAEYIVASDQVFKAEYDHYGSVPTVGVSDKLAWSTPREWVSGTFRALAAVDTELLHVTQALRTYGPVV